MRFRRQKPPAMARLNHRVDPRQLPATLRTQFAAGPAITYSAARDSYAGFPARIPQQQAQRDPTAQTDSSVTPLAALRPRSSQVERLDPQRQKFLLRTAAVAGSLQNRAHR